MNTPEIKSPVKHRVEFSPWVYVTNRCTCACPYCNARCSDKYAQDMSFDNMMKIIQVCESFLSIKAYDHVHMRIAGGEPMLNFDLLKQLPMHNKDLTYGILTNGTVLTDPMIAWLLRNNIGMQISLDDYMTSKIDINGNGTAQIVLNNIQRLFAAGYYNFQVNTVYNPDTTDTLIPLFHYLYGIGMFHRGRLSWGLTSSFTDKDPTKTDKIIRVMDEVLTKAASYGVDLRNRIRLYNTLNGRGGCSAGTDTSVAIGTELDMWPCQSMVDKEPIGKFDHQFQETLKKNNDYFYRHKLATRCHTCAILEYCCGGCKAEYMDQDIMDVTCTIKKEIIGKLYLGYYQYRARAGGHQHACGCDEGNYTFNIDNAQLSEEEVVMPETECRN